MKSFTDIEQSDGCGMISIEIRIGKGLIEQISETYTFSTELNKNSLKDFLINDISDEKFEILWEITFGETFEDFVDKMLK